MNTQKLIRLISLAGVIAGVSGAILSAYLYGLEAVTISRTRDVLTPLVSPSDREFLLEWVSTVASMWVASIECLLSYSAVPLVTSLIVLVVGVKKACF